MNILNPESLIETVDRFNDCLFFRKDGSSDANAIVEWTGSRLGKEGAYAGSFAMTPSDWNRPFRLFTGEPITSRAGRAHVIAQETTRMLRIIANKTGKPIAASGLSEAKLSERIFNHPRSIARETGHYCCGTCSVAFWRTLNAGGFPLESELVNTQNLQTLRRHRDPKGGWKRFPFYYTLLFLSETASALAKEEIIQQLQGCRNRLRSLSHKQDPYSQRRIELLNRIIATDH